MSVFEQKATKVVEEQIRGIQSPLLDQSNQLSRQNTNLSQVVTDGYIPGGGALSANAALPGGDSVSNPLVGSRLLRPGDVAINVGGRLF